MTNIYNGLLQNIEHALGHMQRHDTERVLEDMDHPEAGPQWIRNLHSGNPLIAEWHAEQPAEIVEAQHIAQRVIAPVFTRDTRTNFYTRSGGNLIAGLTDLWVQKDPLGDGELRQAHIVEYDLINMEAVLMASEKMLHAIDDKNAGQKRRKTTPKRVTDGYIRVVNGLVYESFAEELEKAGMDDVENRIHPVRLSNGDEFRMVVIGLDDEQVAHANMVAKQKVQQFVSRLGFDALPHLKYLKDVQAWNQLGSIENIDKDPDLFKAFQYGGAGIKIGAVELGCDQKTADIEHELDIQLRASREERAALRGKQLQYAVDAQKDESLPRPNFPIFNHGHKLAKNGFGTVLFSDPDSFIYAMKVVKEDDYRGYYLEPKVEALDFPYNINPERENAYPYNNPEHYIDEFIAIASSYVTLTNGVKARLQNVLREELTKPVAATGRHQPQEILASTIMAATDMVLEESYSASEMPDVLKARAQFADKRLLLRESLEIFSSNWNPYESFDLTRKRILDKEADKLNLNSEQRAVLFYAPLELANARHEDGYCMSGRVKAALQVFQGNDKEIRQFSYIGLTSFAGVNEVSTALGRSVNENIRHIAADEFKKRFGKKSLDFAFAVESGRLNVLTHGIAKNDLIDALSEIEMRVEKEINQLPLEVLLRRYHIFTQPPTTKVMISKSEHDEDMMRLTDEVQAAQDKYGQDTPLVFDYGTEGEVSARPLSDDEIDAKRDAIAAGKHLFLMQRSRHTSLHVPEQVEGYLKAAGYVNDQNNLDLSKPLAILPNPKHTHEHGVRVVTAYVELLGNAARLADQRKDELFRLVEVKKRSLYEPGKGYEVPIPVESMPNLTSPAENAAGVVQSNGSANGYHAAVPGTFAGNPRNKPAAKVSGQRIKATIRPFVPTDQEGWLRQLDQREFEMLQQRKVPETLLQMITDNYVHVECSRDHNYVIHVLRQDKGYDREDPSVPRRRAAFIKHALEEHFGQDALVTGLPNHASGTRSIKMRVRPADESAVVLKPKQRELVNFFDSLAAIKGRQEAHATSDLDFTQQLEEQVQRYRYQLRAINMLRHYPNLTIELPRNQGGNFVIKLPQEPGERKTVWKQRCDGLLKEFQKLLSERAVELEETGTEVPKSVRTGGNSLKSRVKYQIRIESNPVSDDILNYMESIQQPEKFRSGGQSGGQSGGRY